MTINLSVLSKVMSNTRKNDTSRAIRAFDKATPSFGFAKILKGDTFNGDNGLAALYAASPIYARKFGA